MAKQCLSYKVNLVTASYVSPEMAALHEPAREAGITLINEVGLDPGIDHMLAMACIDETHSKGGKVLCGSVNLDHSGVANFLPLLMVFYR